MPENTTDGSYVVCPYCGTHHGDCFEWCNTETPQETECSGCGRKFKCWAEYSVLYCAERVDGEAEKPATTMAERLGIALAAAGPEPVYFADEAAPLFRDHTQGRHVRARQRVPPTVDEWTEADQRRLEEGS